MNIERRKHPRISPTAFLNKVVTLKPLLPYFGRPLKGKLIDLSEGGMAILINELIPQETTLQATLLFPDQSVIESVVRIRHVLPWAKNFIHGFEFLTLSVGSAEKIQKMSSDYIDCENRIQNNQPDVCRHDCAFFSMCAKEQKLEPALLTSQIIEMEFHALIDPSPKL